MDPILGFFSGLWAYQMALGPVAGVSLVLGLWLGDFMGRRYPNAWSWLRAGLKQAGDAAKDAVKG